jgi:ribosomal protein S14
MLFSKIKDTKTRKKLFKLEYKLKSEKFVFINLVSKLNLLKKSKKRKLFPFYKAVYLSFFKKHSGNKVKIVRRCLITNRSKGVYRPFNFSRLIFRDLLQFGLVPGYKKAVW